MRRYGKHTDEDDIRSRPNRRGNRPRTHIPVSYTHLTLPTKA